MKKLIAMTFGVLFFSAAVMAGNNGQERNVKRVKGLTKADYTFILGSQLKGMVNYPEFAASQGVEGAVMVRYKVVDGDVIQVLDLNSNDERLKEYVFNKLDGKHVKKIHDNPGDLYVKFDFALVN